MDLERFVVTAQDQGGVYDAALNEMRAGQKRSHWMWFVFPQIDGLGSSAMAQRYALQGLEEAEAHWAHPVLGPRLADCCAAVGAITGRSAEQIFGPVDAMKFHSSLTLFARAVPAEPIFEALLQQYFGGETDDATLALLGEQPEPS